MFQKCNKFLFLGYYSESDNIHNDILNFKLPVRKTNWNTNWTLNWSSKIHEYYLEN